MKKKNSLKDMLKGKRPLIGYKGIPESRTTIIKKSLKEYEICPSTKENHVAYGKFM